MPHLIAYSARNEEFGRAWRARAMEHLRGGLKELIRRGIDRQIFSPLLDEELAVALLLGPMVFRHIFRGSLDKDWLARGAVDALLARERSQREGNSRRGGVLRPKRNPQNAPLTSQPASRRLLTDLALPALFVTNSVCSSDGIPCNRVYSLCRLSELQGALMTGRNVCAFFAQDSDKTDRCKLKMFLCAAAASVVRSRRRSSAAAVAQQTHTNPPSPTPPSPKPK